MHRLRSGIRSKGKTWAGLAVIFAVMFGIVLTLAAGALRTSSASDRYSASQGGRYDASVEQISGQPRTAELAGLPAVDHVTTATFVFGGVAPAGAGLDEAAEGLVFAGDHAALGTRLVEGREPDPTEPGEFAATRSFLELTHASLGERFDLWVIPQGPADALGYDAQDQAVRLQSAVLVGVVDGPSELQDGYPLSIFPTALLDAGDVGIAASPSVVSLAPGSTIGDLRAQIDELPDPSQFGIDPGDWVPSEVRAAVRAQGQGLAILAVIAATATVVVAGQLLSRQFRLVPFERRVLRAVGMTRGQIAADQVLSAGVPVLAGVVTAVAGAWLASGLFPRDFVLHVEPDPGRRFETAALVPGAVAIAALVLGWVLIAVVASDKERHGAVKPTTIEVLARQFPAQAAIALRFAFTRQPRDATRPAAAVVGAAVIVAVLVGALTFGASLDAMVDRPDRWGVDYDLALGQGGELPTDAIDRLEQDPDVAAIALYATVLTTVGTEGFDVSGVQPVVGSTAPHLFEGRLAEGADEIVIGRVAARRLGVDIGDELVLVGPAGAHRLRITGLAVLPAIEGGDGIGEGGLVTFDGLRRIDPSTEPTAAVIRLRPGASADTVAERISSTTGLTTGGLDRPVAIINVARARPIPYLVAAVLAVLVVLNLAHHLILSTQRRRRDLAILRALGADRRWITAVVHWQATLFTILVTIAGTWIGLAGGRSLYRTFIDRIGAVDTVTLPTTALAATLIGLLALANIVAVPNAHRTRQQPPSAILSSE